MGTSPNPLPTYDVEGWRPLTADEAVQRLVTGDHAQSAAGTLEYDSLLIDLIREGLVIGMLSPQNVFGLRLTPEGNQYVQMLKAMRLS